MKRAALVLMLALGIAGSAGAEPVELGDAVNEHVREIRARNPELRDDAFSKMGGSSVASKAFLYCFSTPYVELGEHQDLAATVQHFDTGRRNSFNRQSEAAGVSWNLRYVLGGRPANFRQEIDATQARWALVLFGGNDAQNENERVYLKRLVYLVEKLEEMGVVPILGSALPRRNTYRDRWIRRFNAITEAVAEHWSLPYIDYHAALNALPRKGLARDGVHPNVLGQGGVRAACQLTERGLRYGNNVRNLLTLEMLDALRSTIATPNPQLARDTDARVAELESRVVSPKPRVLRPETRDPRPEARAWATDAGTGTDTDAGIDAGTDTGTDTVPEPIPDPFPISALISKSDLPPTDSLPNRCGSPKPNSRLYRTRLDLSARTRLRASALDL
ncbi:MAG: SGNH/GDSL hydrolase family protein, partial [Deltaproteobacteria bacterium]|nr:SGNH/GDSL hydrolase family protein [Deltaproteobacteria bacterium]